MNNLTALKVAVIATDGVEETDVRNAGAEWVDREVVVDRNWVTSRQPGDIPAFNREVEHYDKTFENS